MENLGQMHNNTPPLSTFTPFVREKSVPQGRGDPAAEGRAPARTPEHTVQKANEVLNTLLPGMQFQIDTTSGKLEVLVYDSRTGDVIRRLSLKDLEGSVGKLDLFMGGVIDTRT